jgi:hypothetical protein
MKNKSYIFAASSAKTILLISGVVAFFYASNSACLAANKGLSNSNGCCTSQSVIVFAETEGDSLSYFKYFNFSFMAKTTRDYSGVKHSNALVTPDSAKTVSFKKFQIEMNAKNQAYYFILSHGLLDQFTEFCENYHSDDPHADCVRSLLSKIQSL